MSILDTIATIVFQQMELREQREQACVIIQTHEGGYYATRPSMHNTDNFRFRVVLRPGEHIAAIIHTHPVNNGSVADGFSVEDKQVADQMHLPSYVYFATLGQIRVYFNGIEHEVNRYVE